MMEEKGKEKVVEEDSESTEEYELSTDPIARAKGLTKGQAKLIQAVVCDGVAPIFIELQKKYDESVKEAKERPEREQIAQEKNLKRKIRENEQKTLPLFQRKDPKQSSLAYHKKLKSIKEDRSKEKDKLENDLEELRIKLFELIQDRLMVSEERKEEIMKSLRLLDVMKLLRKYKDAVAPFCSPIFGRKLLTVPLNRILDTVNLRKIEIRDTDKTLEEVKDILQKACMMIKNFRFELE